MSSETFLAALRGYVPGISSKYTLLKSILILNGQGKTAKEIISVNTKAPQNTIDIEKTRRQIMSYLEELKAKARDQAAEDKKVKLTDRLKENLKFMDEYGALSYVSHVLMLALIYLDILNIHQDLQNNNNASKKSNALTKQALVDLDAEVKKLQANANIKEKELERLRGNASGKNMELTTLKQELARLRGNASGKNMELERLRANASAKNTELERLRGNASGNNTELERLRANASGKNTELTTLKQELERLRANATKQNVSQALKEEIEKIKEENEKLNRFKTAYEKLTTLVPAALDLHAF